jgi:hypothetical protein
LILMMTTRQLAANMARLVAAGLLSSNPSRAPTPPTATSCARHSRPAPNVL